MVFGITDPFVYGVWLGLLVDFQVHLSDPHLGHVVGDEQSKVIDVVSELDGEQSGQSVQTDPRQERKRLDEAREQIGQLVMGNMDGME